MELLIELGN